MGKAAVVEFEGTRYTLSLISWGILRRTMQGAAAKAMMGVPFVPGYGLAVWQGAASTQILGLLCYFPDKQTAKEWFTKIEASIKQDGLANPWNILMEDQTRLYLAPFCRLAKGASY